MATKVNNMTYDQLIQAYEKAAQAYHRTRLGTVANEKAGKRMDKAVRAVDAFLVQQIRLREGGPAIDLANGSKLWYLNGKQHRADGPAAESLLLTN